MKFICLYYKIYYFVKFFSKKSLDNPPLSLYTFVISIII